VTEPARKLELEQLIDTNDVARILRCSRNAVVQMCGRGKGPKVYGRGARGLLLFDPADVDAWLSGPRNHVARAQLIKALETGSNDHVYFLHDPSGFIKIGTTGNLSQRLRDLQAANPRELVLLGTLRGDRDVEIAFHIYFADLLARGEWFTDHPVILETLLAIKRGSFTVDGP
jgi:hypothetical protein